MYSYRLTVEVDTPKDLRTGSSVIAVSATEGWGIPDTALRVTITGEAVAVDLPGGTLFALLGTRDNFDASASLPLCVMLPPVSSGPYRTFRQRVERLHTVRGAVEVPDNELPVLVRFRDINDPTSVQAVDPVDLSASFGPGVRLRRATIEMTDQAQDRLAAVRNGWRRVRSPVPEPEERWQQELHGGKRLEQRMGRADHKKRDQARQPAREKHS
jgi:hypothetical protein